MKFENKIIIVTGAAGGIGKEVVRKLVSEKAKVVLVDLNEAAIKAVQTELSLTDENSLIVKADVSKEDNVKNYVDQTISKFGRIDGFVNNAGVEGPAKPLEEITEKEFDFVYGINVKGVLFGLKYVLPVMKEQKSGSIVNTSSVAGLIGSPSMALYNSSKHAVMGLNKVAALEAAAYNVRVNTVNPGVINTQMMRKIEANVAPGAAEAAQAAYNDAVPMKRYGEPEEVANVIAFLLSDEASYVSSSSFTIDGALYNV
ncbi:dehydrogenase with different specificities [Solibacillus silvestris StLB046]|uniref:Dehydrogenase with different specificities n=1 Tax=Solibacillus silvestris (strain StLB046) TaxID=1002809 RepID=F2F893_SOLSS|nr:SDR family NAD(P)-dependent oxidoreductase [Solibacillus silvestris]BAK17897.1 dehydrogenase with different specificities [Solibacillus silvestris StLB046]